MTNILSPSAPLLRERRKEVPHFPLDVFADWRPVLRFSALTIFPYTLPQPMHRAAMLLADIPNSPLRTA